MRLDVIRYETKYINLYEFTRPGHSRLPEAEPGAHIGLHLPNGLVRQYSLIETGNELYRYIVGIKREDSGKGGSLYIHESLRAGTRIDVEPPRNNFPLVRNAEHTVLIAGGIGITPIYSMVQELHATRKSYELHYACRTREEAAFLNELTKLDSVFLHFDDEHEGWPLNIADIVADAPQEAHIYCCGPTPMLEVFEEATSDRPHEMVHVEYFAPKEAAAVEGGFTVVLAQRGEEYIVPPGQTILQTLLDAGLDLPFSCEEGVCGTCETSVIEGSPDHRDVILSEEERNENKTMMICCSGCKGERLVLDL